MAIMDQAAGLAQLVEQRTCNAKVGGSIPLSGTTSARRAPLLPHIVLIAVLFLSPFAVAQNSDSLSDDRLPEAQRRLRLADEQMDRAQRDVSRARRGLENAQEAFDQAQRDLERRREQVNGAQRAVEEADEKLAEAQRQREAARGAMERLYDGRKR
jgi:septal ring factor EnvC (AmiA/AmiB activator)